MLLCTILRSTQSVMIVYILHTFHSILVYYNCSMTTIWKHFIDTYCDTGNIITRQYQIQKFTDTHTLAKHSLSLTFQLGIHVQHVPHAEHVESSK